MRELKPLILLIILGMIFIFIMENKNEHLNITHGDITKGQLSLDGLEDGQAIALDGEWEFYWNQLLNPTEFTIKPEKSMDYYSVPKLWKGQTYQAVSIGSEGAATYRMFLHIKTDTWGEEGIALKIPYAYSAYKLWFNGNVIAENGVVSLNKKDEIVVRKPQVVNLHPRVGKNEIVLQISNHHFYRGGLRSSILIGTDNLFTIREKQIASDIFMSGSFFILAFIFLLLYIKRRDELSILYFSLICFVFFSRTLFSNEIYISNIFNNFNWEIGNRVEAGFSFIGIPLVILMLNEFYRNYFDLKFINGWKIFLMAGLFITALFPHKVYDNLLIYVNILQLIYGAYLFFAFIKYYKKTSQEFYVLLFGKATLTIFGIHDIIITYSSFHDTLKMQMGTYLFVLSLGYALVLHLNNEFCKVEGLVLQNENMLREISTMNLELEKLVDERTRELEDSNRQLYELSMLDGLTRISNRLQFDEKLDSFFEKALNDKLPLSILFIDLDFFKDYNDNYGHIKGDEALKQVSEVLNQEIKKYSNAFVARYGGEEFVALFLNKNKEETYELAESLRLLVHEMNITHQFSKICKNITISIGAISTIPSSEDTPKKLLNRADIALYRAKEQGRNRTIMWRT